MSLRSDTRSSLKKAAVLNAALLLSGMPPLSSAVVHTETGSSAVAGRIIESEQNKRSELLERHRSLLKFLNSEIELHKFFPTIKRVKETNLRVLIQTTCKELNALLNSESGEKLSRACAAFESALVENELKAKIKGYIPPDASDRTNKLREIKDGRGGRLTARQYAESGYLFCEKVYTPIDGVLRAIEINTFYPDGQPQLLARFENNCTTYFEREDTPVAGVTFSNSGEIMSRYMFDEAGNRFGSYATENLKNGELTKEAYLDYVARNINTPAGYDLFLHLIFDYVRDGAAPYMQSPEETMDRDKDGAMRGNCLDMAEFMREILERQGKSPIIVSFGKKVHAAAVILTFDGNNYHAETFCNYGYDKNGNRFAHEVNPARTGGASSPAKALRLAAEKYSKMRRFKENPLTIRRDVTTLELDEDLEKHKSYKVEQIDNLVSAL